jgi:hypothetical protein
MFVKKMEKKNIKKMLQKKCAKKCGKKMCKKKFPKKKLCEIFFKKIVQIFLQKKNHQI